MTRTTVDTVDCSALLVSLAVGAYVITGVAGFWLFFIVLGFVTIKRLGNK